MSNQVKIDPFNPAQPRIPGVATDEPQVDAENLQAPVPAPAQEAP